MPVGLVAFEVGALSLESVKRFRTRAYSEVNSVGNSLRKHLNDILTRARPNNVTVLLVSVALYLVLSRCGPVLSRVGESTFQTFDLKTKLLQDFDPVGLKALKGVYKIFRGVTRVPGPFARRSFAVVFFIMGNKNSSKKKPETHTQLQDEGVQVKEAQNVGSEPSPKHKESSKKDGDGSKENPIRLAVFEEKISTGDLAILKRSGESVHNFAVFVQHDACDPTLPLLLIKGKTKPLQNFNPNNKRHAHPVTAANRIFYGDYEMVSVRRIEPKLEISCHDTLKIIDEIPEVAFSNEEIQVIQAAPSAEERSSILCTFMIAHFYKKMGVLKADPNEIRPSNLETNLSLTEPTYIKLPAVKEGPVARGDPPFLSKLVDGIMPPPDVETVPLGTIIPKLQTGDLVLFSGATSSGAIIKFFDRAQFSHIGIITRTKYSSQVLVWEASTNKAGLVDVESGKVRRGVELLPLKNKIFSGWYNRVAIRQLTGIEDDKRQEIYEELLKFRKEVQGRPYEKNKSELILSAIDFQEDYLSFLRNTKEDLSSLFCSELVAAAYQRMGLLDDKRLSNEYTPDDFASNNDKANPLQFGKLEKEVYIELKFDFN